MSGGRQANNPRVTPELAPQSRAQKKRVHMAIDVTTALTALSVSYRAAVS